MDSEPDLAPQESVYGQKSALRSWRPGDEKAFIAGFPTSDPEVMIRDLADKAADPRLVDLLYPNFNKQLTYIVSGRENYVGGDQKEQPQGFVWIRRNAGAPFELPSSNTFEIGWVKIPDSKTGQISSGVRNLLESLQREIINNGNLNPPQELDLPYNIVAKINKDNLESINVAEACGFTRLTPDGSPTSLIIYKLDWKKLDIKLKAKALEELRFME